MTYDPNRPMTYSSTDQEIDRTADKAHAAVDQVAGKAQQATSGAQSTTQNLKDKAQDVASTVQDKAQDVAAQAQQALGTVQDKAQDVAAQASDKADQATTATGEKLTDAAQYIRENAPASGTVGNVAVQAADKLEQAGTYLQQQDLTDMRSDIESIIRRHPMESLLVGLGIGYLLARSTRR